VNESAAYRSRACPLCGSQRNRLFLPGNIDGQRITSFSYASRKEPEFLNFPLSLCLDCDLVYAHELPNMQTLGQAYREAEYDSSDEAGFAAATYVRLLRPWLQTLSARDCAVDIGAGNGALLPLLEREGFHQVIGVEPSEKAIAAAPAHVRPMLRSGMLSAELLGEARPDLVCVFQTLEHVDNPFETMRYIHVALRRGGLVALVVHNRRALLNLILGRNSPIIDIEHLQLFSRRSLEGLLRKIGLFPVVIQSFWNSYPLSYWIRLLPLPAAMKHNWILRLRLMGLTRVPVSLPVGNLFALGRKDV